MNRKDLSTFLGYAEDMRIKFAEELQNKELPQADRNRIKSMYRYSGELYILLDSYRKIKDKEQRDAN